MADEEFVEGAEEFSADEGGGAEFVPESTHKPKPDVYSVLLILAFVAFFIGILIAGRELHQSYDVQFWVFTKK